MCVELLGLPYLHIKGDSSAIINWFNGQAALEALDLDGWCQETSALQSYFIHFESSHVYRDFNVKGGNLSKEALFLPYGILHYLEFSKDVCHWHGSIRLY